MPTAWKLVTVLLGFIIAGALAVWMRSLNYSRVVSLSGASSYLFRLDLNSSSLRCVALAKWRIGSGITWPLAFGLARRRRQGLVC